MCIWQSAFGWSGGSTARLVIVSQASAPTLHCRNEPETIDAKNNNQTQFIFPNYEYKFYTTTCRFSNKSWHSCLLSHASKQINSGSIVAGWRCTMSACLSFAQSDHRDSSTHLIGRTWWNRDCCVFFRGQKIVAIPQQSPLIPTEVNQMNPKSPPKE